MGVGYFESTSKFEVAHYRKMCRLEHELQLDPWLGRGISLLSRNAFLPPNAPKESRGQTGVYSTLASVSAELRWPERKISIKKLARSVRL